jgi:hypothetical protein
VYHPLVQKDRLIISGPFFPGNRRKKRMNNQANCLEISNS